MSDSWYQGQRNGMLGAPVHSVIDFNTDDVRVILRDEGADALNLADEDLADIAAGARIAVSAAVASPTVGVVSVGTFDHADIVFATVTGASIESLDYYKHTGTESTSPLAMNIDSATGLPMTPNGGNINYTPNAAGVVQIG